MRFFPLLAITLLLSCSSGENKPVAADSTAAAAPKPSVKAATITDLNCAADPANSYAVYLPANFDSTKKYPLVVFFDAHGNGHLPLEKYKTIADQWGIIFAGSNVSKNGMDGSQTMKIGGELIDEMKMNFPVDEHEVMVCGFSGGSRVAANIALFRNDVKGMICNSAAPQQIAAGEIFIGLAGLRDMNYIELKKFNDSQSGNTATHELLVFDGKHEWAPVDVMEDALLISGTQGEKHDASDSAMAKALAEKIVTQAGQLKNKSCLLAKNLLETGSRICSPFGAWNTSDNNLVSESCVKSDEEAWKKAEEQESGLQTFLAESLLSRDTTWWRANAETYFDSTKTGPEKFMRCRLRGYMSLNCYTYANQAFHMENYHAAEKMVKIYSIVDPTNSEWAYMQAVLYVKLGLSDYVLPSLSRAVDLGFNDVIRIETDANFASFRDKPEYGQLLARMKQ